MTKWPTLKFALAALFLSGCAETRLYEHGQLIAVIQGDATNVTLTTGNGFTFHADTLNHSTATTAAYTGVGSVIGAVAGGVATAGVILK